MHLNQFVLTATLSLLCFFSGATMAKTSPLRVAVSANFNGTFNKLACAYQREFEQPFLVSSGSSGSLFAKIKHAAPYHLFFSADKLRPALLDKAGLTVEGSRFTYAIGIPVLWSKDRILLNKTGKKIFEAQNFKYIAIADPRIAPYGLAAKQILQRLEYWDDLNTNAKIVKAQSIGQTYGQVASRAAEMGFLSLSQVKDHVETIGGSYWIPPQPLYDPIEQQAVILNYAKKAPRIFDSAVHFLNWVKTSQTAKAIIKASGYKIKQSSVSSQSMSMHSEKGNIEQ
ncbi:molybdate ABC transporter substrate-binding protein [Salinivibrio sp. ML290]|uniref:molybdate ABC transporter substrate-binding protein n=1 Tax=Salinivibrio sp. ML290 TaxID=1909468 RepID=UPI000988741C|nr:molybdate ABC transporter substrate-binding protein [Salinivibrio sp. ML290]OOE72277.1 molybdate ABC transporter substrate-binding protein [Salinivibrio sp. ML290]